MAEVRRWYHPHLSIQGALENWYDGKLSGLGCTDDNGRKLTGDEIKAELERELASGKRVLPLGRCDNFDFQQGCMGHTDTPPDRRFEVLHPKPANDKSETRQIPPEAKP